MAAAKAPARPAPKKKRPAKAAAPARKRAKSRTRRYGVEYDTSGPKIRLGVAWFLLVFLAPVATSRLIDDSVGAVVFAAIYGVAAAGAAAQTARCWQSRRVKANAFVAAGFAGGATVAALAGPIPVGLTMIGLAGTTLFLAGATQHRNIRVVHKAGMTVQAALLPALAGSTLILMNDSGIGTAIALVLLASSYEVGDYVVGTGAPNRYEGPIAGLIVMLITTSVVGTTEMGVFSFRSAWLFGLIAMVLVPLGQLAASAMLPRAASPAPALRRIDSLLLAAPVWYFAIELFLH